jgi:hypothetical protein
LPLARLELSQSLQRHWVLPGRAPVLLAAYPGGGVRRSPTLPPAPPHALVTLEA